MGKEFNSAVAKATEDFIKQSIVNTNEHAINLGKWLALCKEKGHHKNLGYETFNAYLSSLGIMPRSATRYINIVKKYIIDLKIPEEELYPISMHRLERMIQLINKDNVGEWLSRAATCSNKDFIDLVSEELGQAPTEYGERAGESLVPNLAGGESTLTRLSPKQYKKLVRDAPCVLHPDRKNYGVGHHFPQRRRRGADWKVIPLCAECHAEADGPAGESNFWLKYKGKLMSWFYNLIVEE